MILLWSELSKRNNHILPLAIVAEWDVIDDISCIARWVDNFCLIWTLPEFLYMIICPRTVGGDLLSCNSAK